MDEDEKIVSDDTRYVMKGKGQIVAHDRTALREYKRQAHREHQKHEEINTLRNDVDNLKSDISEIKSLLSELVNKEDKE